MSEYRFYAHKISYYSGIVRPLFKYKKIPYTEISPGIKNAPMMFKQTGSSQIPQMITPKNEAIQDTTVMCEYLEHNHPEPSIIPINPRQHMLMLMVQIFANDFMIIPAMHYRWSFKLRNWRIVYYEFADGVMPNLPWFMKFFISRKITKRIEGAYRRMGSLDKDFLPEIEKWYEDFLSKLNIHFSLHRYLLGGKPSIGDFALMGPMYAHLGRDTYPKKLMQKKAPNVWRWVQRMNNHPNDDTSYLENDEIPKTLIPVLDIVFKYQGAKTKNIIKNTQRALDSIEKNEKLLRFNGKAEFILGNYKSEKPTETHIAWLQQRMMNSYDKLDQPEQESVNKLLKSHNWYDHFMIRLKTPLKRVRNKYYHHDSDEKLISVRDADINEGAFSAGTKSRREKSNPMGQKI